LPRFLSPGPLFALEMVTSVRRARYFLVRVLYAAILLLALFFVHQVFDLESHYSSVSQIAAVAQFAWRFFSTFAVLQLLAVVVFGPAMAAGTIASERERRTIEYLFASTLSNAEIVLGKLLARLMHVAYLVLAGMPILFIAMLMGGIAPEAIVVLMIITLSTALTVSIISITVSVWTPRARDAVVRAYLVLIVLLLLPPLTLNMRWTWFYYMIDPLNEQMLAANPFYVLGNILTTASSANTAAAWDSLLALVRNQAIVCVLGITASTLMVRRVHLSASGKTPKKRRRRFRLFRPAIGDHPMLWKEIVAETSATRLGAVGRIALMLIAIAVLTPTILAFLSSIGSSNSRMPRFNEYPILSLYMSILIGCGGLLLIAARAAGSITSEKERDCWVSLISTPLEPSEIIFAKIIGNIWAASGLLILLAIIWGLGIVLDPGYIIPVSFTLGTLLLLAGFAGALGVIYSLRCRTSTRAIAATLATGIFVGGAYMFCCIPFFFAGRMGDEAIIIVAGCIPYLLGCPTGLYLRNSMSSGHVPDKEIAAYVLGMIGYAVATVVLIAAAIRNFDRLSDRTCLLPWDLSMQKKPAKPHTVSSMPPATEEIIQAEIVEEA
jgi:ABC-type transport system involved in multi-copper enzyme maturation permease subunit